MRLTALRKLAFAALASSLILAACDLSYDRGDPFFGSGASPPSSSSGRYEPPSVCESAVSGAACDFSDMTGTSCERGASANPRCNEILSCSNGRWIRSIVTQAGCDADCPSTMTEDAGAACSLPNANAWICEYPEGTCGCAFAAATDDPLDGGADAESSPSLDPDPDPDPDAAADTDSGIDAGDAGHTGPLIWRCVRPEVGCPRTRPRAGAECVRPLYCDYGASLFEDGIAMRCENHRWSCEPASRCGQ